MNVSSINAATTAYQTSIQSTFKQRAQDFKALQSALQSGDLSGAQQAFATLQKDRQGSTQAAAGAGNASSQSSPMASDIQTLQSALQSGDLSSAQSAFATLKQDLQSAGAAHQAHRHHHHAQAGGASSSTGQTSGSTSSTTDVGSVVASLLNAQA
jgi:ribosomal protein S20